MNRKNFDPAMAKISNVITSEKIIDVNNKKIRVSVSPKVESFCNSEKLSFCGGGYGELLRKNYANFRRSGEPGRVMYCDETGSWVDYPVEVTELVKKCFGEGRSVVEVMIRGSTCLIDLYRMLEIDLGSGFDKLIAWIDVNGKCFFPQVFGRGLINGGEKDKEEENLRSEIPKIEIEVKICENDEKGGDGDLEVKEGDSYKRKREHEEFVVETVGGGRDEGSASNFRAKRRELVVNEEMGMGMEMLPSWPETRLTGEVERGHVIVRELFLTVMGPVEPGVTITRIYQCMRKEPVLAARYDVFMKKMKIVKKMRGVPNVVFGWHGTSAKGVESILRHGFGLSNQLPGPQAYGKGVHLSSAKMPYPSTLLSEMDNNGEKHLVLCRVLLGNCEKVQLGSQQMIPSSVDFDTGVDDLGNPKWYVVWSNNMISHLLPEVVVSFKPAKNAQGQLAGTSSVKLNPTSSSAAAADLVSRLRRSLPPPKVQELQALFRSFKDGKVGKEIFMKQLRSIVGDAVPQFIINGIQG